MITDIDTRTGWPEELRLLLNRFPRDGWRANGNSMTEFWLDKHDYFRNQAKAMSEAAANFRNDRMEPAEFAGWLVRLRPEYVWLGFNSRPSQVTLPEPSPEKVRGLAGILVEEGIPVRGKRLRGLDLPGVERSQD